MEGGSVEDQCLLLVCTESATAPPSPPQWPGRTQLSAGEEGDARQAPQGPGPPAPSHLQTAQVLSFWPHGRRRRRQAGDRQGCTHLFRSWADSASERKLVKEEKKR